MEPRHRLLLMGPCQIAAELELRIITTRSGYWTSLLFTPVLASGVFQDLDCGIRSLKQIDIWMNGLQGDIPGDGIGNSTQLVHLEMSLNRFNIDIWMNGLQGDIPGDGIGNSTQLVHLDMSLNRFNGSIPYQIFSLTSLGYLDMSENLPEGNKLGPELKFYDNWMVNDCSGVFQHLDCGIRSLKQIDISMNGLQGDIPGDGLGNLTQLVHLDMSLNIFNG
ncbi:leucine-rich repeat-containing protein [Tanacetum coccineum]